MPFSRSEGTSVLGQFSVGLTRPSEILSADVLQDFAAVGHCSGVAFAPRPHQCPDKIAQPHNYRVCLGSSGDTGCGTKSINMRHIS